VPRCGTITIVKSGGDPKKIAVGSTVTEKKPRPRQREAHPKEASHIKAGKQNKKKNGKR